MCSVTRTPSVASGASSLCEGAFWIVCASKRKFFVHPPRGSLWDSLCRKAVTVINNGLPSQATSGRGLPSETGGGECGAYDYSFATDKPLYIILPQSPRATRTRRPLCLRCRHLPTVWGVTLHEGAFCFLIPRGGEDIDRL